MKGDHMKNYKAVIYDIDGTVLNTLNMNMYPLLKIIKEELNEDWTFQEVLKFASYPGMKVMEELNIQDKDQVYQRWVRYVNEYEEGASLYPGFEKVFICFEIAGIIQAVVSAKTQAQYRIDMVEKGLDRYMKTAVLAEDTFKHKPDPEPLLLCLERLKLKPEEVIYIGDAKSDQLAAKNAGIDFGYAKWGNVAKEIMEDAAMVFEAPEDLLALLPCQSEKQKMLAGKLYDCGDQELLTTWHKAKDLVKAYNQCASADHKQKENILQQLLGGYDENLWITPPFYVDYGENIYFGKNCEVNMNCTFLDDNIIYIGDHALIAPNVQIYTAFHPTHMLDRFGEIKEDGSFAFCKTQTKPVIIKDHVWIGGGTVILPGVTIGCNTVIGAGSVVTKDIPDNVIACGNPCRIIKENLRKK